MAEYNSYIDSQIPYVGAIPSHWNTVPNKRVMHKEKRICDSYAGQDIISLTMRGAIVRDLSAGGKMPTTFDGYQFVYPGELLMCLFDIDVTPRCVGRVFNEGLTSPAYSSFVLHNNADVGYFYYYYLMLDHGKELLHLAKNLRHALTEEQLGQIKVPLPPIEEQKAIATYLDRETERIDAIISEAKASIEEYKAWKESIIYETVTKGIDPKAEMKDSGFDYIGDIPSSWMTKKLRNIGTTQNGISKSAEFFGEGYPFVSYGDVYKNYSLPEIPSGLVLSTDDERSHYSVEEGDIFFTRTSETIDEIGFSCVCEKTIPNATFAGFLIRVRPYTDDLLTGFSKYYFRSVHHRAFFVKEMNLVTRASLSQGLLKSMPVLIPPKDEQKRIAEYLDKKCSVVDALMQEKQGLITDLEAFKKSLIFEVVTGKRRVME